MLIRIVHEPKSLLVRMVEKELEGSVVLDPHLAKIMHNIVACLWSLLYSGPS
jgi:hypothetical protein